MNDVAKRLVRARCSTIFIHEGVVMKNLTLVVALASIMVVPGLILAQESQFPPIPSAPCVAHRGFSAIAPENTISSALKAIEVGAQGSEFDVYTTTDGILFLNHDGNLKRTTGVDIACNAVDFPTLAKLDFGAFKGEEFKGEHVATYDEALKTFKGTNTRPVVEIKVGGIEDKIVAYLHKYDLVETAIVIDFNASHLKKIREIEPNLCCAWLVSFKVAEETPESMAKKIIETCKDINTNVVDVEYHAITPEFLKILDDAGITVMCWTVDNDKDIQNLVKMGVKSITTNRPDAVLKAQAEAAK